MSERSEHRARRSAGLLLGAALLLVLGAWGTGLLAGGERPSALGPEAGAGGDRAAAEEPALEREALAARESLGAASVVGSPERAAGGAPPAVDDGPNERELYELYRAALARDPGALGREAQSVLSGDGPRNRRVALLRAAWDLGLPDAPRLFQQALRSPTDDADRHAASLADFAVRFLGERGAREPLAWTTLFDSVHMGATSMEPRLRSTAALRLVESASPSDLQRLVVLVQEEPGSGVALGLVDALRARSDEGARSALRALGLDDSRLEPRGEEEG